jgi:hypothetical protein
MSELTGTYYLCVTGLGIATYSEQLHRVRTQNLLVHYFGKY